MPRRDRSLGCAAGLLLFAAALAAAVCFGRGYIRAHPEQFPWTPLDLGDPVGPFTGQKLAALTADFGQCRAVLAGNGAQASAAPPARSSESSCSFTDGVWLVPDERQQARFTPRIFTACPVAAALRLWMRDSVQPAATQLLGARVFEVETFGSYSCRRLANRDDAPWSRHATGDAIDISAFRLADGRRIPVLGRWSQEQAESRFLHVARDGACKLFSVVLSPDYNAAHRDHLHFDIANGGKFGGSVCR